MIRVAASFAAGWIRTEARGSKGHFAPGATIGHHGRPDEPQGGARLGLQALGIDRGGKRLLGQDSNLEPTG